MQYIVFLAHVGFEVKALEGEVANAYPILRGILPLFISRKRPMMIFPIDALMDEQSSYDFLLGVLHPDGLHCPLRHPLPPNQAPHDRHRAPLYDYKCRVCGKVYNLFTDTLWQGARYPCRKIVLIMRGIAQGVSTQHLAHELGLDRSHVLKKRHAIQQLAEERLSPLPPVRSSDRSR